MPRADAKHGAYMARALELARRAVGRTSPNPVVGAVIVKDGRIVGEGFHRRAGLPHAEIEALRQAGARARGSTLYVTLEPCNHTGRTPPCCDAILAAGVSRVVIAARDPNPITNGRGMARLRRAGVDVVAGVLERDARTLNEPFRKAVTTGLPFVVAKVGQSLDGKIATRAGQSRWITSAAARRLAHAWRGRVDAILVGVNTVLADDPRLTARGIPRRIGRPVRVIADSRLRIPLRARCLSAGTATLIATTVSSGSKRAQLMRRGIDVLTLPPRRGPRSASRAGRDGPRPSGRGGRVPLRRLFRELVRRGIQSVLIEGGGEVLAGAFAERLVDRVVWFIAPILLGGRDAPGSLGGAGVDRLSRAIRLEGLSCTRVGPDLCVEACVVYPRSAHSTPRSATP
jgi:diaminohydroxyphosphoribosylaminopyrimidine deaminase/5-amino-6-(5-phosphoribosylamino)uracil reductase